MLFDGRREVLIVSSSEKAVDFIKSKMSENYYLECVKSGTDARQLLIDRDYDIVIINCPLKDEFGLDLAENIIKDSYAGVMVLVSADVFDSVSFSMEKIGIYCLSKPLSSSTFIQGLTLTNATYSRLKGLINKTESLKEKMEEIRLVGRAKLLLITNLSLTEDEAHKYVEKQAMDRCVKKTVIANEIIKKYND
ncbi:MAG: ANTAR domain-containing protein [Clostridia bacterium]|nr:ANTAR domain-containing protein [Clostridia bacterium]